METPLSLQEIITALDEIGMKLAAATLSQEELDEFQALAALLHERAIILNYKAKEEQVFGTSKAATKSTEAQPQVEEQNEVQEEEISDSKSEEKPTKKPAVSDGILFDFSAPEPPQEKIVETHEAEVETDSSDEAAQFATETNVEEEPELITPEVVSTDRPAGEEEQPKEESFTASRITEIKTDSAVYSFYERFSKVVDDSVMGMLGAQKIESIKGAFGLNDRLQFINELFAGNVDEFNNSIEALDQQKSKEEAKIKLSEIAAQHQWEPDDVLVEDLAKLVQRRYAD